MTFSGDPNLLVPVESASGILFSDTGSGFTGTLVILDAGPGGVSIDGSSFRSCPCDAADKELGIDNISCQANVDESGWDDLNNCTLEVCEGQSLILGTNRSDLSFTWRGPNGLTGQASSLELSSVKTSDAGFYWIYYQGENGCSFTRHYRVDRESGAKDDHCGEENDLWAFQW